jgi:hypothetical protein
VPVSPSSSSSALSHSESVVAFLHSFGLIASNDESGVIAVSRFSMFGLFGEPFGETEIPLHYDKVLKLARLHCIADNVDWDWTRSDDDNSYLEPTFHETFVA